MFKTLLINFGNVVYEGDDQKEAARIAVDAGFEAVIYEDNELIATYSPLVGLREYKPSYEE